MFRKIADPLKKPRLHFFLILVHCLGGQLGSFYGLPWKGIFMMPYYSHTICVEGSQIDHRHRELLQYLALGIQYCICHIKTPPLVYFIEMEMPLQVYQYIHSWHNLNCFTSSTYICVCGANDRLLLLWTLLLIHHFHTYATWEYIKSGYMCTCTYSQNVATNFSISKQMTHFLATYKEI